MERTTLGKIIPWPWWHQITIGPNWLVILLIMWSNVLCASGLREFSLLHGFTLQYLLLKLLGFRQYEFFVGLTSNPTNHGFYLIDGLQILQDVHCIACRKTMDATWIAYLYLKEIVHLHGVPQSITLDRDIKFMSHFLKSLWEKLGTKLNFNSAYHH